MVTGLELVARSWRVLVDEALPDDELEAIREAIDDFRDRDVVAYHKLRTRRAGARRYVDMHVQFRAGTTLEDAHAIAHELQDGIASRLRGADVLIHLEPEDKVREDPIGAETSSRRAPATGRVTSAQVDTGRQGDREHDPRIADVAGQQQDQGGDHADTDGDQPGDLGQRHGWVFSRRAHDPCRTPRFQAQTSVPRPMTAGRA